MAGQDAVSTLLADKIKIVVPMNQSLFGMTAHLPRRLLSHAPRNDETRRAQVHGDHAEVVIHGKVNQVSARLGSRRPSRREGSADRETRPSPKRSPSGLTKRHP